MGNWTEQEGMQALAAISSLKRALGIPNHKARTDEIRDKRCHVYTIDLETAQLLAEIFYKWANGRRKSYYDQTKPGSTLRDTISIVKLPEGGHDLSIAVLQ